MEECNYKLQFCQTWSINLRGKQVHILYFIIIIIIKSANKLQKRPS